MAKTSKKSAARKDRRTLETIASKTPVCIDALVRENTDFANYADLVVAMSGDYSPTLSRYQAGAIALGLALEANGHTVRWL